MNIPNKKSSCKPESKWAALINDQHVPLPQRKVKVRVLKIQGAIPEDHTLFRDFSPTSDTPLSGEDLIDLAEGNVFYSKKGCFEATEEPCGTRPKLAWFVDDRHEVSLLSEQTGRSLKDLFRVDADLGLLRDLDSPNDIEVDPADTLNFTQGPVFVTRNIERVAEDLSIIVNTRKKIVSQKSMSYEQIISLAFETQPQGQNVCITVTFRKGPSCSPQGTLVQGGVPIEIQNGMIFDVSATDKS